MAGLVHVIISNIDNIDLAWSNWKSKFINIIDNIVSKVQIQNKRQYPWIDGEVIHLSNVKNTCVFFLSPEVLKDTL